MRRFVVDASVAIKWYVPEIHSAHALRMIAADHWLMAPDLIAAELANVMVKKLRRGELGTDDATLRLQLILEQVALSPFELLVYDALEIASAHDRSAYDAIYVALALRDEVQLVTADRRLYNALAPALPETMLWVEDVPEPEDAAPTP